MTPRHLCQPLLRGLAMAAVAAVLAGCAAPRVGLPNPAAVACTRAGGEAMTERNADGSERGTCRFPSGQVCDQWASFRGECGPTAVDRRSGS